MYTLNELQVPEPSWLVDGLLVDGGHHMIYGVTGTMKSVLTIDLLSRIENGMEFHGRTTRKGRVVYVVGEALIDQKTRLDDWQRYHGTAHAPLIIPYAVNISDADRMADLAEVVNATGDVRLIVFDTLSTCSEGVELNNPDEVCERINPRLARLRADTGAATLLVHHAGKDGSKRARGAAALSDVVTAKFRTNLGNGMFTLSCEKLTRGEKPPPLRFRIAQQGTSPILLPSEATTKSRERKAPDTSRTRILQAMDEIGSPASLQDIVSASGVNEGTCKNVLGALVRQGVLSKPRHGIYAIVTKSVTVSS